MDVEREASQWERTSSFPMALGKGGKTLGKGGSRRHLKVLRAPSRVSPGFTRPAGRRPTGGDRREALLLLWLLVVLDYRDIHTSKELEDLGLLFSGVIHH